MAATTLGRNGAVASVLGTPKNENGEFGDQGTVTVDWDGNLIVGDQFKRLIKRVTLPQLSVTTICRAETEGLVANPATKEIVIVDWDYNEIKKVRPDGTVVEWIGKHDTPGFVDGVGENARLKYPFGVIVDPMGNIIVSDKGNHSIRKISPTGAVTTIAGNGTKGFADGNGSAAQFYDPGQMAMTPSGDIIVADQMNHRIRRITPNGTVSTLAGTGEVGGSDGPALSATFDMPINLAIDQAGNVLIWDGNTGNSNRIRMLTPQGEVITLVGGTEGFADGAGADAKFCAHGGICFVVVATGMQYNSGGGISGLSKRDSMIVQWLYAHSLSQYAEAYLDIQTNTPHVLAWCSDNDLIEIFKALGQGNTRTASLNHEMNNTNTTSSPQSSAINQQDQFDSVVDQLAAFLATSCSL
ncbi:BspA family leucine-rich repeat surface protein [Pelomyxa schiedti]|nr:BspA family leucine-rich repeat surface protein [Pelomyxa schiedti]